MASSSSVYKSTHYVYAKKEQLKKKMEHPKNGEVVMWDFLST